MRNESVGNLDLKPVTAKSRSVGAVWTPNNKIRLSVDYIDVRIRNEIRALTVANILFDEAACRQGGDVTYLSSCDYALSIVTRDGTSGNITNVRRGYFNVSKKETRSLMVAGQYTLPVSSVGTFRFDVNYNRVLDFKSQADAVSPVVDQLKNPRDYGMFKDSLNTSLTLETDRLSATAFVTRYGKSANYALINGGWGSTAYGTPGWDKPWTLVNLSARYDFGHGLNVNGVVNNVANRMPPSKNWTGFPGYNPALYNVYGRSFSLEVTKSF
jgi:outer membrane receptor protein involved in Fe transport